MGQRLLQLNSTATANPDGSATLHVSMMPRNVALFAPGPAYVFVVINGVPSQGQQVMVGSGALGTQRVLADQVLPASSGFGADVASASGSAASPTGTTGKTAANVKSGAVRLPAAATSTLAVAAAAAALFGAAYLA
jgi:hypothetical protein